MGLFLFQSKRVPPSGECWSRSTVLEAVIWYIEQIAALNFRISDVALLIYNFTFKGTIAPWFSLCSQYPFFPLLSVYLTPITLVSPMVITYGIDLDTWSKSCASTFLVTVESDPGRLKKRQRTTLNWHHQVSLDEKISLEFKRQVIYRLEYFLNPLLYLKSSSVIHIVPCLCHLKIFCILPTIAICLENVWYSLSDMDFLIELTFGG